VRGADLDGRSDQFSLAVVCFEALTGRRPFEGESIMAIFAAVAADEAPRIESLAPSVPKGLCDGVARALSKRPDARFADLDAFAAVLEDFVPTDFEGIDLRRFEARPDDARLHGAPTVIDLEAEHPRADPTTEPRQLRPPTPESLDAPERFASTLVDGPDESAVRTVVRSPPRRLPGTVGPDVETERFTWNPREGAPYRPLQAPPPRRGRVSRWGWRVAVALVALLAIAALATIAARA
jgi:serine/threonine protein kinase